MNVVFYGRGATPASIEFQLNLLHVHARQRGWTVIGEYTDTKDNGKSLNRPGLNALRDEAGKQPRPFEKVAVLGIDRISRVFADLRSVVTELEEHGIAIINPNEPLSDLPKLFRKLSVR